MGHIGDRHPVGATVESLFAVCAKFDKKIS